MWMIGNSATETPKIKERKADWHDGEGKEKEIVII